MENVEENVGPQPFVGLYNLSRILYIANTFLLLKKRKKTECILDHVIHFSLSNNTTKYR